MNNEKESMIDFWKGRWGTNGIDEDYGLMYVTVSMILGGIIWLISSGVTVDALANHHTWQAASFISTVSGIIFSAPYVIYKKVTHIPRRIKKAQQKQLAQEIELRELRIREKELGLDPYEYGKIS